MSPQLPYLLGLAIGSAMSFAIVCTLGSVYFWAMARKTQRIKVLLAAAEAAKQLDVRDRPVAFDNQARRMEEEAQLGLVGWESMALILTQYAYQFRQLATETRVLLRAEPEETA